MRTLEQAVQESNPPSSGNQDHSQKVGVEIARSAALPRSFFRLRAGGHFPIETFDADFDWDRAVALSGPREKN